MPQITAATLDIGANGQYKATQGTITADKPAWNSTATWNSAGVTFTHLKANVTDTASAAASLLIDLQVGGVSKFKVTKAGGITATGPMSVTYDGAAAILADLKNSSATGYGVRIQAGGNDSTRYALNVTNFDGSQDRFQIWGDYMESYVQSRLMASVAAGAPLRIPHGAAPTAPVNGDIWTTSAGLYVRVNGATVGPLS